MNKPHKHAEVIKAWANGAEIQCSMKNDNDWFDVEVPDWDLSLNYRIKPEPKYPETWMGDGELAHAFHSTASTSQLKIIREGVNTAIRRAIQDGDVVLPGEKE
jgi:hypothetical protein